MRACGATRVHCGGRHPPIPGTWLAAIWTVGSAQSSSGGIRWAATRLPTSHWSGRLVPDSVMRRNCLSTPVWPWDAKTAIRRARSFEEYRIFWLEEPLMPDDYEGYRRLSEAVDTRIAAGEEESNRASFVELMDSWKDRRGAD